MDANISNKEIETLIKDSKIAEPYENDEVPFDGDIDFKRSIATMACKQLREYGIDIEEYERIHGSVK